MTQVTEADKTRIRVALRALWDARADVELLRHAMLRAIFMGRSGPWFSARVELRSAEQRVQRAARSVLDAAA